MNKYRTMDNRKTTNITTKYLDAMSAAGLRLNRNDSRILRVLLDDLVRRDGSAAFEASLGPAVSPALADMKMNGPQKLDRIKEILRAARYPASTRAREAFSERLKELDLHPRVLIKHTEGFEDNALEVSFRYKGRGELEEILKSLERLAGCDPVEDALAAAEDSC